MKINFLLSFCCLAVLLSGCETGPTGATRVMSSAEYADREPIATSLFPSDQAVLGDEAVEKVLSRKLELPAKAKLALMKFPDPASRGYGYWRDQEYSKLRQEQVDTLSKALLASDQIAEVTPLPGLMTPSRLSIPILREAAVRMQADLLFVFRVGSDTYTQYRAFAKDKTKAYSTAELVLLDVRTGLVPFTRVVSRERAELKQSQDLDLSETTRRAEEAAAAEALRTAAEDLVTFLKSVPRKGG